MESSCDTGSVSGSPTSHMNQAKNLKHFKKALIVEYERVESHHSGGQEDSNSSESSAHSTASSSTSSNSTTSNSSSASHPTTFENSISILAKSKQTLDDNYFKRKLDLYNDENTSTDTESNQSKVDGKKKKVENKSSPKSSQHKSSDGKQKPKQQKLEAKNSNAKTSKEDKSSKKKIYCICKSADTQRFMM